MNQTNQYESKWSELKGKIKAKWSKLTDENIDSAQEDYSALSPHIQQAYGIDSATTSRQLDEFERANPLPRKTADAPSALDRDQDEMGAGKRTEVDTGEGVIGNDMGVGRGAELGDQTRPGLARQAAEGNDPTTRTGSLDIDSTISKSPSPAAGQDRQAADAARLREHKAG